MKIYIASPLKLQSVNQKIYEKLINAGFQVFLPEDIDKDDHTDIADKKEIAEICYNEIEFCNVIVIVCPFGISVACEIGFAICQKRKSGSKKLILFNTENPDEKFYGETMLIPYIDYQATSIDELINIIMQISKNNGL